MLICWTNQEQTKHTNEAAGLWSEWEIEIVLGKLDLSRSGQYARREV